MSVPVILVVVDDASVRAALDTDLGRRYRPDFEVLTVGSRRATVQLDELADAGRDVAVVLTAADLPEAGIGGVELLADVRRRHPQTRRLLLVDRAQWRGHPVREAMVLGQVDSYVFVPWAQREPWLYLPVTEALADWERSRPAEEVAATIVGDPKSRRAYELRDIFSRAAIPFEFLDAASEEGAAVLTERGGSQPDLPLLLMHPDAVLTNPDDVEIVEQLGFVSAPPEGERDVAVIGAGPGGMSAAVYATSEGLRTVVVTPGVPGGQAGTSSMIRNYLGFPRGLAGSELTNRAVEQAWLFGAEMVLADQAVGLVAEGTTASSRPDEV
jgi:thioredoxin reductase (NADPH)